jgi:hypothetical protein
MENFQSERWLFATNFKYLDVFDERYIGDQVLCEVMYSLQE